MQKVGVLEAFPDLAGLPPSVARELTAAARIMAYSAGEVVARIGERFDPGVVTEGMLRLSIRSDDGRRATVRYIRTGEAFGTESLFQPMSHMVVAVSESKVTHYDRLLTEQLMRKHPSLALNVAHQLAASLLEKDEALAQFAFMTVAQRVVHQLVALAEPRGAGESGAVARISQQELADAVGSVREVVARVIRNLKEQRVIETSRNGITISSELDLYRFLRDQARPRDPHPGPA